MAATNSGAFFDDLLTDAQKKEEAKKEEAPKPTGDFFDDLIAGSAPGAEEEAAPPSDPDTITTGGFFDDLIADASTPDELKALKEKGVFLPDDKEKVIYDASRDEPISTKVGKFFKGILPAGWGIVKNTAIGAKDLAWKGIVKPALAFDGSLEEIQPDNTYPEAGNTWRSFGSGAVKAIGGLEEAGTKAAIGGTAITDKLKEVAGLQTPEDSFNNYLTRTHFQDALNRESAAHPDAMAHGLAGLADAAADSGLKIPATPLTPEIGKNEMSAAADSFREQELTKDQINPNIESVAEVTTPIGPVATLLKPASLLTKGATEALGRVALKGATKVVAPLIEKGGDLTLKAGEGWEKITQAAAQAVSGDPHALWQKIFSEPVRTTTILVGTPAKRLGEAGKDIGRQIDDVGQAGRTGLFERAGADATSGPVIKTIFGKGIDKEEKVASGLEDVSGIAGVGEKISEAAKATGPFRARTADRLSRALGYYTHKGIDGAVVGTLLGIPNIENAEDFGTVVGSGVGIGLVVGSAPSAIRQARVEALRGDQDADIARMRRDAAPETVAKLDSLTDRDAYLAYLKNQVDAIDAGWSALQTQPDSPAKKATQDHLDAVRKNILDSMATAVKAKPGDMKETNRLLQLEFTDDLDQAKTTASNAGLGNNLEVHLLSSDEIAAKVDSMFAGDKEQAEAVISHLTGKTLTPDEQASFDAAKQKLADIATNREHWPQQRGFALEAGAIPDNNAPAIIINSDHLLSQRGTNLARVLRHEIFHGLMNFNEVKEKVQPLVDSYFDTKIKLADGTVVDGDRGIYSDADLDKMIPVYARKLDPLHDGQQWLSRFNTPEDARNAIKEELLAENFTHTSKQGALRSVLDSPAQSIADWWHLTNLNKSIAETRDQLAEAGLPLDGSGKVSDVLGAKLTDQSLALMRKFQRQMRNYNEGLTLASDSSLPSEKKIPFTKILANRALQEHFKDADFWAREAVTQVLDASGNPVHEQVLTPKEAETMPVGEWVLKGGVFTNAEDGSVMPSPAPAEAKALPDGTRVVNKVRIARKADGTPKILSKSVVERLSRVRGKLIQEALDGAPDAGEANRLRNTGNGSYRGVATPAQIARVMKLPDVIVHPALKAKFKALNDSLARGDGTRHITEYQPALLGGEYRALSPKISDFVPIGFQFSKQGNFLVTVVSVSRLHSKMEAWVKQKPARLDLWKGDTGDFWQDFIQLLHNHQQPDVHGEVGLDADPKRALEKKNILNDFLNLSTKETEANNPDRSKLKTPKGKDSPDRTISSYRLDRMLSLEESYAQKMPIDYGKVVANFLPADENSQFELNQNNPDNNNIEKVHGLFFPNHSSLSGGSPADHLGAAADVLRGSGDPGESSTESKGRQKVELTDWAREAGVLLDKWPKGFPRDGKKDVGGMEHHAFYHPESGRYIKFTKGNEPSGSDMVLNHFGEWGIRRGSALSYLDRLQASREIFGDDVMLHGVVADKHGNVSMITSQKALKGEPASYSDIREAMESAGYVRLDASDSFYNPETNILVSDLHPGNGIKVDGKFHAFDAMVSRPDGQLKEKIVKSLGKSPEPFDESKPLSTSRFDTSSMPLYGGKPLDDNSQFLSGVR